MKTIFITGASTGLGKATAKLFAANGWKVIATMRKPENETELTLIDNITLLPLDVTNPGQIKETTQKAMALGNIDVVFNNAGYGLIGPMETVTDEQLVRQLDTNVLGVIRVTQAFISYFRKKQNGLFITTTSIGGLITFPLSSVYHATKWALEGWSESLAFELNQFGIGVKTISPGGIKITLQVNPTFWIYLQLYLIQNMKSEMKNPPFVFNSISELHRALGLPKPLHPLVSLVEYANLKIDRSLLLTSFILNFYKISFKKALQGKIKYGQNYYDFDEGGLVFISPNQLFASSDEEMDYAGYTLLIHPDFIKNHPLGKNIKKFGFFSYSANEALHLSEKEKQIILSIFENIEQELTSTIDDFSQDVMISHIEVLLNYSNRFYKRQFITRKAVSNDLLEKLETLLNDYFNNETALMKGLPTVQYLSEQLNVSPGYLSDMLRSLTAQSAQQHIHNKLIEKAKEILSTSNLSVAEVAYQLGFEHPQSFNKIFKRKTNLTPIEFKQSFN